MEHPRPDGGPDLLKIALGLAWPLIGYLLYATITDGRTTTFDVVAFYGLIFWALGTICFIIRLLEGAPPDDCVYDERGERWCREPGPPLMIKHMMSRGEWPPRR